MFAKSFLSDRLWHEFSKMSEKLDEFWSEVSILQSLPLYQPAMSIQNTMWTLNPGSTENMPNSGHLSCNRSGYETLQIQCLSNYTSFNWPWGLNYVITSVISYIKIRVTFYWLYRFLDANIC